MGRNCSFCCRRRREGASASFVIDARHDDASQQLEGASSLNSSHELVAFQLIGRHRMQTSADSRTSPMLLNAFEARIGGTENVLLPCLVPDPARVFLGLHWSTYDKLWFQASSVEMAKFNKIGLAHFCKYLRAHRGDSGATYLQTHHLHQFRMCWHPDRCAAIALSSPSPRKYWQLENFTHLFWAWFGAAVSAGDSPPEVLMAEEAHVAFGLPPPDRPRAEELCERIISVMDGPQTADPVIAENRIMKTQPGSQHCSLLRYPTCGCPVGVSAPRLQHNGRGLRYNCITSELLSADFGLLSCTHPRGFNVKEKICEACRITLSSTCAEEVRKRCSRCNAAWYCNEQHQKLHWKYHKVVCSKHLKSHLEKDGMFLFPCGEDMLNVKPMPRGTADKEFDDRSSRRRRHTQRDGLSMGVTSMF